MQDVLTDRRGLRRPRRRHRLEPHHVLPRPAVELVARARRRHGRRRRGRGRLSDVLIAEGLRKIGVFIVLSPLIGLALGLILTLSIMWAFHRYQNVERLNRGFRRGQLVSAAAFSLGHGGNDAQKTMGIILAVLIAAGHAAAGCRRARCGSCCRPTPPSAWARCPADGAS